MWKFTEICDFNKKSEHQPFGPGTGPYAEGTKTRKTSPLYFLLGYLQVKSQQETDGNIWKRWRVHEIHLKEKFGELWKMFVYFFSSLFFSLLVSLPPPLPPSLLFLLLFTQVPPYQSVISNLESVERNWSESLFCILHASCPNHCVWKRLCYLI